MYFNTELRLTLEKSVIRPVFDGNLSYAACRVPLKRGSGGEICLARRS